MPHRFPSSGTRWSKCKYLLSSSTDTAGASLQPSRRLRLGGELHARTAHLPGSASALLDSSTTCSACLALPPATCAERASDRRCTAAKSRLPANQPLSPRRSRRAVRLRVPPARRAVLVSVSHASSPACIRSTSTASTPRVARLGNIDFPMKSPGSGPGQLLWCTKACVRSWLCTVWRAFGWLATGLNLQISAVQRPSLQHCSRAAS